MIDSFKFRLSLWLLRSIRKEHFDLKTDWNRNLRNLERLFPHRNLKDYCKYCEGKCTHSFGGYSDEDPDDVF